MNAPIPSEIELVDRHRSPAHPVDPLFVQRWSPRAFEALPMPRADLMSMLEAARWAPSAYNVQPWRFVYASRDEPRWDDFVGLLDPFNAAWAGEASALVFLLSSRFMPAAGDAPAKPSATHRFDAGAAWAQLALQATRLGYHAHAMAGIRRDAVRQQLAVPDDYEVEVAVAIGRRAAPEVLPEALRKREQPSPRRPLHEIAFEGRFDAA